MAIYRLKTYNLALHVVNLRDINKAQKVKTLKTPKSLNPWF